MASQIEGLWKGAKRSNKVIDVIFCYTSNIPIKWVSCCMVISLEKHPNPAL